MKSLMKLQHLLLDFYIHVLLLSSGEGFAYTDTGLGADTVYSYVVQASNGIGTVSSGVSTARTYMSSPSGLSPPTLQALTSTSIS